MSLKPLPLLNTMRKRGFKQGDPFREKGTENIRYFWREGYTTNPTPPSIAVGFGDDYIIELSHASDSPLSLFGMSINSFETFYEPVTPSIPDADELPDA